MIITFTSPTHGLGQSTMLINFANILTNLTKDGQVLIVDINRFYYDIENYLSDTFNTKGLDDFCELYRMNLLQNENIKACKKQINSRIDIMTANKDEDIISRISSNEVGIFQDIFNKRYEYILIDGSSFNENITKEFYKISDKIIVMLFQSKKIINIFLERSKDFESISKCIFILNKYNQEIKYRINEIKRDLNKGSNIEKIFTVDYNFHLINDINSDLILNFINNKDSRAKKTIDDISKIVISILNEYKIEFKDKKREYSFDNFKNMIKSILKGKTINKTEKFIDKTINKTSKRIKINIKEEFI